MAKKKTEKTEKLKSQEPQVKSAPQVNDVAKPGETAALPTSRPVIAGHTPMIKQDPMVSVQNSDSDGETIQVTKSGSITKKADLKVDPIENEEPAPEENISDTPANDTAAPDTESSDDKPENNSVVKDEQGEERNTEEESSEPAAIDSLATSAENKKLSAKAAEEEKAGQEKIKELISSKKYSVQIVEGGHKATSQRFMSWLLVFLLLASAGVYLAVDAGYLDVGIALPYDLIKN